MNPAPNTQVAPFTWGDISLTQAVHVDGVPHATKQAIGEYLEYAEPRKRVNTVLERNPYIEAFSVDLKLRSTDGKNYDTSVYHPMGFLLIAMESNQPKAQQMKVAIAHFVWHFSRPQGITIKERNGYIREIERLTDRLATTNDAMLFEQLQQSIQYYCHLASWPLPNFFMLGKDPKQLELGFGEESTSSE